MCRTPSSSTGSSEATLDPEHILPVLVVENDLDSRDALATLLEIAQFQVVAVDSADRALELLEAGTRPRVILLDVWTPGMSAVEFLRAKACAPAPCDSVPVIAISGDEPALEALSSEDAGGIVAGAVRKPFHIDDLIELIRRVT